MNFNSTKRAIISSRYFYVPALQNQQAQMMKIVIDFTIYVGWRVLKTKEERVITIWGASQKPPHRPIDII